MKNKKNFFILKTIFFLLGSTLLLFLAVLSIYIFAYEIAPLESSYGYYFDESLNFDLKEYTQEVAVSDESKILILTDIHFYGTGDYKSQRYLTNTITKQSPELIIIVGDSCFTPLNYQAYQELIKFFDSFKIPWAPIFGNHDNFGPASKKVLSDLLERSTYCLYQYGPNNFQGAGNYVLNISVAKEIKHSLILMDSHTEAISANPGLEPLQVMWYAWIIHGLQSQVNPDIISSLFVHVPINEYNDAWQWGTHLYGDKGEASCVPAVNSGIFEVIKSLGSTKNIISGHDHYNNFIVNYQGIDFIYATKSAYGSYYDTSVMGCLVFTLNSQNNFNKTGFLY
ncbi:MAG: metallophosphoesterase [Acholeplasmatales bacterium]|jgi:predicted MPP superfamily phosphohydrolase|nr:metallophosphoesterase [Acholeplasmatales bacterium]